MWHHAISIYGINLLHVAFIFFHVMHVDLLCVYYIFTVLRVLNYFMHLSYPQFLHAPILSSISACTFLNYCIALFYCDAVSYLELYRPPPLLVKEGTMMTLECRLSLAPVRTRWRTHPMLGVLAQQQLPMSLLPG